MVKPAICDRTKPATQAGVPFVSAFDAAQRGLRACAFATPLLQSQSPQRSEDAASPEQSGLTCPGDSATQQESEGGCLLQCLYMADRCDRRCAGCIVTARHAAAVGGKRSDAADAAGSAGQLLRNPDGNHGESNLTEGKSS